MTSEERIMNLDECLCAVKLWAANAVSGRNLLRRDQLTEKIREDLSPKWIFHPK